MQKKLLKVADFGLHDELVLGVVFYGREIYQSCRRPGVLLLRLGAIVVKSWSTWLRWFFSLGRGSCMSWG